MARPLNIARFCAFTAPALIAALTGCSEPGGPPTMLSIDDQVAGVGQELVVSLRAVDPDGDKLEYSFSSEHESLSDDASIAVRPDGTGVFRWTPVADDLGSWAVDFTASDDQGSDTVTAMVEVRSELNGSAPIFREPLGSGTTLDLERASCLSLDVVVEDTDDAEVMLGQAGAVIDGAELLQETGTTGFWNWCPSKDQLDDDRYPLVLSAEDGDSDPTFKNYLIVLRHPPRPDCPGDAPVITHSPVNHASVLDLKVEAEVSDELTLRDAPLLYYTDREPSLPIDFAEFDVAEMELSAGDMRAGTWEATIPNPVAGMNEGDQAMVYYIISASDDDDPEGSCDHVTDSPEDGAFVITVTNPGGMGGAGVCEECSADAQCGKDKDLCVIVGNESETFCLETCETNAQCGDDFGCVEVTSIDGATAKQCVPDANTCDDEPPPVCDDDAHEENDTRPAANPLSEGTHEDLVACGGDDDWYEITLSEEGTIGALLEGDAGSEIDLGLYDSSGDPVATSTGAGASEVVEECVPAGTYYLRAYGYTEDANYDLDYEITPESCSVECVDDSSEDDDNISQAVYSEVYPGPFEADDRMLCSGDDDFYEIALYTFETIHVDLTFAHNDSSDDLDLHFFEADGTDLTPCTEEDPTTCTVAQGQSADDNEHYEYTVTESGCAPCTFYVSVHGFDAAENNYDLSIALQ